MAIEQVDQDKWVVTPGFLDAHNHPRAFDVLTHDDYEPANLGLEGKAGLKLTTEVALRAGFTGTLAMGNETLRLPDPGADEKTVTVPYTIGNHHRVLAMASRICGEAVIPTGIIGLLDPAEIVTGPQGSQRLRQSLVEQRLAEIDPFTVGTKIFIAAGSFGNFDVSVSQAVKIAQIAHHTHPGKPIVCHAEGQNLEKFLAATARLPEGRRMAIDIAHVSSQQELEAVMLAKSRDYRLNVQAEMTPHHGLLDNRAGAVVKPNLKAAQDIRFLWAHLQYIDRFGSDNAPHRISDKIAGTPGLANHSFMIPFLLAQVKRGRLTMRELDEKLSVNPRQRFNIPEDTSRVVLDTGGPYHDAEYYDDRCQVDYQQNPLLHLPPELQQRVRLLGRVVRAAAPSSHFDEVTGESMKPSYGNFIATASGSS